MRTRVPWPSELEPLTLVSRLGAFFGPPHGAGSDSGCTAPSPTDPSAWSAARPMGHGFGRFLVCGSYAALHHAYPSRGIAWDFRALRPGARATVSGTFLREGSSRGIVRVSAGERTAANRRFARRPG
jgi:hypothetical protein